jgi:flagella basal body P-ring formation protein FlgA
VSAQNQLQVPQEVVLTRPGQKVGRAAVVRAVEQALAPRLSPGEKLRIVSLGLPGPLPAGELELEVRLPDGPIPSPTTLWIDVFADGERGGQAWVRAEIYRPRPVVVLTRDAQRGEVLRPEDLEVRSADAARGGLADPAQAIGKRLVRTLRAGAPVSGRDLQVVPLVERGDVVRLVARVGGVVASVPGKALDSAGVGEVLLVENVSSGQALSGVLRDGGVVEVTAEFGR